MIAAGLCMMGGCFAQNTIGQAEETYWPSHAVHIDHRTLIIKDYASDLPLPLWTEGMQAGGRLENVSWTDADNGGSNILCWGVWDRRNGYLYADAFYLGSRFDASKIGAEAYSVTEQERLDVLWQPFDSPVAFMECAATYPSFTLTSPAGVDSVIISGSGDVLNPGEARIRVVGQANTCDVVSYWWRNDVVQKRYFMVQPMHSVTGLSAFFTHGYNILTEL